MLSLFPAYADFCAVTPRKRIGFLRFALLLIDVAAETLLRRLPQSLAKPAIHFRPIKPD